MGKLTISLSLVSGGLYYKDSEAHSGKTITSHSKSNENIEWTLAKDSGIKSITDIQVSGTKGFFATGPERKNNKTWHAKIGNLAEGEVSYIISYEAADSTGSISLKSQTMSVTADEPPKIKIP